MPLHTTTVQGRFYAPTGASLAGYTLVARLDREDSDAAANDVLVPCEVRTLIDADSAATLPLWPNARGMGGSQYAITVVQPRTDAGGRAFEAVLFRAVATVPVASEPVEWQDILNLAPAPARDPAEAAMLAAQQAQAAAEDAAAAAAASAGAVAEAMQQVLDLADQFLQSNHAGNAPNSWQLGRNGSAAGVRGRFVMGGDSPYADGFAQSFVDGLVGLTEGDGLPVVLTTDGEAPAAGNQCHLRDTEVVRVRVVVVATTGDAGNCREWLIDALVRRRSGAGSTALVGVPVVTSVFNTAGAAGWTAAVQADTANGALAVVVNSGGTVARWSADVTARSRTGFGSGS